MLALLALLPALALAAPAQLSKRYSGVKIQANRDGKCLSVKGLPANGAVVQSVPCESATTWDINPGSGSVLMNIATNFALDAGSNPGNNGALKIWDSYPGLFQQTWYLTDDKRIAITGGDQCLDEGDNGIQTYQCTTGNTNQVFNIIQSGGGSTPSSSASASASASSAAPSASASSTPPAGNGLIRFGNGGCLGAFNGFAGQGSVVKLISCFNANDPFIGVETFDFPAAGTSGLIKIRGKDLCVDAGSNPANGGQIKLWTCYPGLLQQTWTYNSGTKAWSIANNQCLDVARDSTPDFAKPYASIQDVQTWECSNNEQQRWTV